MRAISRASLELSTRLELNRRARAVADRSPVQAEWESFRRSVHGRAVVRALAAMSGERRRCMYCQDSLGSDVEHFRPKVLFPELAFRWSNLLLICSACNRRKSSTSPDSVGGVSLIDPTQISSSWHHFVFVRGTGRIEPRFGIHGVDRDAEFSLTLIPQLNAEAVCEGRREEANDLLYALRKLTDEGTGWAECVRRFARNRYGLAEWYAGFEGRSSLSVPLTSRQQRRLLRATCSTP